MPEARGTRERPVDARDAAALSPGAGLGRYSSSVTASDFLVPEQLGNEGAINDFLNFLLFLLLAGLDPTISPALTILQLESHPNL